MGYDLRTQISTASARKHVQTMGSPSKRSYFCTVLVAAQHLSPGSSPSPAPMIPTILRTSLVPRSHELRKAPVVRSRWIVLARVCCEATAPRYSEGTLLGESESFWERTCTGCDTILCCEVPSHLRLDVLGRGLRWLVRHR